MSKADEMFEELGYEKIETNDGFKNEIEYTRKNKYSTDIIFDLRHNVIVFGREERNRHAIIINTLQAINEKVKELGWNEK